MNCELTAALNQSKQFLANEKFRKNEIRNGIYDFSCLLMSSFIHRNFDYFMFLSIKVHFSNPILSLYGR